jgi:hypothetical protein
MRKLQLREDGAHRFASCSPAAPPPPDYVGAAREQGASNKEAAIAGAQLSNPNFTNPYGTRTVEYRNDPTTGNPVPYIKDSYSPEQQKLLDTGMQTQQALGNLGLQGANMASGILGQQFDIASIPGIERTNNFDRESIYGDLVARATDQNTQDRDNVRSNLVARGIPEGSEAWNREMGRLDRGLNDARQQANLAAGQQQQIQLDARRQMITEALANRQTPLQEINALRSGSQVAPLQFQNYSGQNVAAAPIFGATVAQGNAAQQAYQNELSSSNGLISGLGMLGSSAFGGARPWWLPAAGAAA